MSGLTSRIEAFLLDLLQEQEDGVLQIQRSDIADRFQCAPSQINYVLRTRFTDYNGYYIESKRGGTGYVRIVRLEQCEEDIVDLILDQLETTALTCEKSRHYLQALLEQHIINKDQERMMRHVMEETTLRAVPQERRNLVRAHIFRSFLQSL